MGGCFVPRSGSNSFVFPSSAPCWAPADARKEIKRAPLVLFRLWDVQPELQHEEAEACAGQSGHLVKVSRQIRADTCYYLMTRQGRRLVT